jgi:hypothetical protein
MGGFPLNQNEKNVHTLRRALPAGYFSNLDTFTILRNTQETPPLKIMFSTKKQNKKT